MAQTLCTARPELSKIRKPAPFHQDLCRVCFSTLNSLPLRPTGALMCATKTPGCAGAITIAPDGAVRIHKRLPLSYGPP